MYDYYLSQPPLTVIISFVFCSWIINEFKKQCWTLFMFTNLAGGWADAASEFWEIVGEQQSVQRLFPFILRNEFEAKIV